MAFCEKKTLKYVPMVSYGHVLEISSSFCRQGESTRCRYLGGEFLNGNCPGSADLDKVALYL